jgi:hypothetical protein
LLKGKRMEPVFLVRLLRATAMACCITARGVVGSEPDVRGGSCLVCQRQLVVEDNSRGMVVSLRAIECAW